MATYFRCFLTNNSRYDLKLKSKEVRQFSLIHQNWDGNWDIAAPDLIKAGQQADPNRATFQGSATGIDGVSLYVQYHVMEGAESRGVITINGRAWNDLIQNAEAYVIYGGGQDSPLLKLLNVEHHHHPRVGGDITQRVTFSNK